MFVCALFISARHKLEVLAHRKDTIGDSRAPNRSFLSGRTRIPAAELGAPRNRKSRKIGSCFPGRKEARAARILCVRPCHRVADCLANLLMELPENVMLGALTKSFSFAALLAETWFLGSR